MKTSIRKRIKTALISNILTPLLLGGVGGGLLTACYHDKHEFQPNESDEESVGYVTPQLLWENESDSAAISSIDNLSFQIKGNNGVTRSRSFSSVKGSADWLQQLPVGEYDILVTADMDESSGYQLVSSGSSSSNSLTPTSVSLQDFASSPRQSWYAVTHVTILDGQITVADFTLQRLLPTLTVNVTGVPSGTKVAIAVEKVACLDARSKIIRGVVGCSGVSLVEFRIYINDEYVTPSVERILRAGQSVFNIRRRISIVLNFTCILSASDCAAFNIFVTSSVHNSVILLPP